MSRIEKNEDVSGQMKQMKGEVVKEIRKGKQGSRAGLTCAVIFLVILLGAISWVLWVLAATGLFAIPGFSAMAFSEPEPTRIVEPGASVETVLQEEFASVLTERFVAGGGVITDKSITIPLSERAMTASIRELIQEEGELSLRAEDAQVVVTEEGLELFVPYDGAQKTAVSDVYLGKLKVPEWFKAAFITSTIEQKLPEINAGLAQYATLSDITYKEGLVEVSGTFEVEFK